MLAKSAENQSSNKKMVHSETPIYCFFPVSFGDLETTASIQMMGITGAQYA